jgi:hypothetical protein
VEAVEEGVERGAPVVVGAVGHIVEGPLWN